MFSPSSLDQQLAATWLAARTDRPRAGERRRRIAPRSPLARRDRGAR
jgi:hypothetical protein